MNVLVVSKWFYPAYTGAGIRFQRYAPGMSKRGIKLHFFTSTLRSVESEKSRNSRHFADRAVIRIPLSKTYSFQREWSFAHSLFRYCRAHRNYFSVIHLLTQIFFGVPFIIALRKLCIPMILSYTLLCHFSKNILRRKLQRLSRRIPLQFVDYIIAPSIAVRDALWDLGVETPVQVIPNGVDLQRFKPPSTPEEKKNMRKKLGFNLDGPLVLFVGALIKRKGIDLLLEAWRKIKQRCPNSRLVLVGPIPREMAQSFKKREIPSFVIDEMNEKDAGFVHVGCVSNIEDFYRVADLLVFPSLREGMPNVVLESFASGLPVVMTDFLGLSPELGCPNREYILVDRTPADIANAVISLINSPRRRKEIGSNARRWVERYMDLERVLDQYAEFYRSISARKMK